MRRRVLLVSYHFPPVGGAGVQRVAKLAQYLPEFGWDVSVLQAENPSVPLFDESLMAALPADLMVVKARTLEPSYAAKSHSRPGTGTTSRGATSALRRMVRRGAALVLQPDAQVLWLPAARRAGSSLLRRVRHHAILATAPAYSNLLLGATLKRRSGLPLLADFRDEWDLSNEYLENATRDGLSRRVQRGMQRRVLRAADAIVATTRASTARLADRAAEAGASPLTECIYNGWDAGDLAEAAAAAPVVAPNPDRFRLVYTGTLWNLTSLRPIADAVTRIATVTPRLLERMELVIVGRKTPDQQLELARITATPVLVHAPDYVEHAEALATMATADALLLLLSNVPGAERVIPAKLFEYLASRRPILGITPRGEAADLVGSVYADGWRAPDDGAGIEEWLRKRLEGWPDRRGMSDLSSASIAPYERRALAGQMASVLDRITRGAA